MASLKDQLSRAASGERKLQFDPAGRGESRLLLLPVSEIEPDPNQPRRTLGDVTELADSLRERGPDGLLHPIVVEAISDNRFRIIAGHRRHAAFVAAGIDKIPSIVRSVDAQRRLELQIVENLHRESLLPLEEAAAIRRLMIEFDLNQRDVAGRIGKSLGAVNEALRLLDLPAEIQQRVHELATVAPAKSVLLAVAKAGDKETQKKIFAKAVRGEFTSTTARESRQAQSAAKPAAKRRDGSSKRVLHVGHAVVTVTIRAGDTSSAAFIAALKQALVELQKEATSP